MRDLLIEFLDNLREYTRESGNNLANDERESREFVDIFLSSKNEGKTPVSGFVRSDEFGNVFRISVLQQKNPYLSACDLCRYRKDHKLCKIYQYCMTFNHKSEYYR